MGKRRGAKLGRGRIPAEANDVGVGPKSAVEGPMAVTSTTKAVTGQNPRCTIYSSVRFMLVGVKEERLRDVSTPAFDDSCFAPEQGQHQDELLRTLHEKSCMSSTLRVCIGGIPYGRSILRLST